MQRWKFSHRHSFADMSRGKACIKTFSRLIDLYMSQHFSVKNDSKLNSYYLNLTVFSIVVYQWKIIVNNVIIDLLSYSRLDILKFKNITTTFGHRFYRIRFDIQQ